MFCPKCGQPQTSEAVRFCSKCGFELDAVKSLVNGEEMPAATAAPPEIVQGDGLRKKREQTKGAFFMFLFALVVAALTVDMPRSHSSRIFFLTIAWLTFTLIINLGPLVRYFRGKGAASEASQGRVEGGAREAFLPAASGRPLVALGERSLETGEMIKVPSVTERTTSLLGKHR